MMTDYLEYYQPLLAVLESHQAQGTPEISCIEACFKSSLDCWSKVQQLVKERGFQTAAEEIRFFKEIKPRFTGLIEYYTQRYHALLFMPVNDNIELGQFWRWEGRKIERFYENNEAFCRYMQEGATDKDEEYFLRDNKKGPALLHGRIHDLDPDTSTSHDYLVTMLSAYRLYERYINGEIKKLEGYFFLTG
jgi:hypothetical protein